MKKGRPLKMTVKTRKDAAWDVFSLYIRLSAVAAFPDMFGDIPCFTCGDWHPWKDMQAGHGIGGRNNAVLFMEEVVKPQCERCNGYLNGNYKIFALKLIQILGAEKYEELLIQSNQVVKMTPMQFLDIQEKYQKEVDKLKNEINS